MNYPSTASPKQQTWRKWFPMHRTKWYNQWTNNLHSKMYCNDHPKNIAISTVNLEWCWAVNGFIIHSISWYNHYKHDSRIISARYWTDYLWNLSYHGHCTRAEIYDHNSAQMHSNQFIWICTSVGSKYLNTITSLIDVPDKQLRGAPTR